jgi:hypothetical protein
MCRQPAVGIPRESSRASRPRGWELFPIITFSTIGFS